MARSFRLGWSGGARQQPVLKNILKHSHEGHLDIITTNEQHFSSLLCLSFTSLSMHLWVGRSVYVVLVVSSKMTWHFTAYLW